MNDDLIIGLYFERDESAIAETEKKYGAYCRYIARSILGSEEEARQIENDTYLKIWSTVPPEKPDSLKSYAGMVCRTLAINEFNKHETKKRKCPAQSVIDELAQCIPDSRTSDIEDDVELRAALNTFIRSLDGQKQSIFIKRYFYAMPVSQIASELSLGKSNVKMTLMRLREKLRDELSREGIDI